MPPDQADKDRAYLVVREARSYGIQVFEQPGCYDARDRWLRVPYYIVDHHDASTLASGEWGSLGYITSNRISNFQVSRGLDGVPKFALVAAGANCPHAGLGGPWGVCPRDSMNGYGYGVEKAGTLGEKYTPAALYATQGLYHAIEVVCGRPLGSMVVEHEEWGNIGHPYRKSDSDYGYGRSTHGGPGGNGNWMRQQVARFAPTGATSSEEEDEMFILGVQGRPTGQPGKPDRLLLGPAIAMGISTTDQDRIMAAGGVRSSWIGGPEFDALVQDSTDQRNLLRAQAAALPKA